MIAGQSNQKIVDQDECVVPFAGLRPQASVPFLIVPKNRIPTLNDAIEADALLLGRLLLAGKKIAHDYGIAESGYRLALNNNEDAGQSVFHLHVHLLGGMNLGPTVPQTYSAPLPPIRNSPGLHSASPPHLSAAVAPPTPLRSARRLRLFVI